jgi:hypothetical protein
MLYKYTATLKSCLFLQIHYYTFQDPKLSDARVANVLVGFGVRNYLDEVLLTIHGLRYALCLSFYGKERGRRHL